MNEQQQTQAFMMPVPCRHPEIVVRVLAHHQPVNIRHIVSDAMWKAKLPYKEISQFNTVARNSAYTKTRAEFMAMCRRWVSLEEQNG